MGSTSVTVRGGGLVKCYFIRFTPQVYMYSSVMKCKWSSPKYFFNLISYRSAELKILWEAGKKLPSRFGHQQ